MRLCVDYRELNKVIIKNRYFLFLINETLNHLNNVKRFIKLDFKNIYYRIRIRKNDEWKTAFRTRYNHFEYIIMSFDLINAFAIFQIYINKSLSRLINKFYIIYLNNIFIYFDSKLKHLDHIK